MRDGRRAASAKLGRWGEERAAALLRRHGWRVLARNYRFGRREIDLVVRRRDTVAFVEVKTRSGDACGAPEEAVTPLKRREIELVATEFVQRHRLSGLSLRFDVVAITVGLGGGVVRELHIADAWRPGWP